MATSDDRYVAAIEISSSKIIAAVGKMRPNGQLDILATEQEKGVESIRYGVIRNLEEAAMRIHRIISKLERKPSVAPRKITSLFVGLSGLSLRSIPTNVSINLPDDTEITQDIITRMLNQARGTAIDSSLEVMDAVPRSYTVGRMKTMSPIGNVGNSISAVYDLVVCRPELKNNLTRTVHDKRGIPIKGIVVTALAVGQIILSAEEKRLGCMLVDMGAETTTVTIYRNGHLHYFATLPLGGRNISRDLTSLNILEERAEEIKISHGSALPRENPSLQNYNGVRDSEVSNIIVARAEEIVVNIIKQIQYAELKDSDLPGGIVVIGGASKLNGIIDLIADKSGLNNVRRGVMPPYIKIEDTKISASGIIEVASILYAGASGNPTECLEFPRTQELPVTGEANKNDDEPEIEKPKAPKRPGFLSRMRSAIKENLSNSWGKEDDSDLLD